MSSLTGQIIYQYYGDLLTTKNSGLGLSATLEPVQDGIGQSSPMRISLNAVNFDRIGGNTFQLDGSNLTANASDINSVARSNPILPGTGGVVLPSGTTAQRLAPPVNGTIRYNTQLNALEAYQNGAWGNLQAGAVIGPNVSVTNDIAIFGDTTGKLISDSGVQITSVAPPLLSLGHGDSLATDLQISGVDILNFGSSTLNDVGIIFRQTDYVLGIFPNTIVNKFPNIVLGFSNPSSTDSAFELTEGALLLSRLSTAQRNTLVPIDGMMIYNTTTEAFNFYQNGTWADLATGAVLSVTGTANEIVATGTSSVVLSISDNPIIPGFSDIKIPSGTTAQRPVSPTNGMVRYNTDLSQFEGYQGGAWISFGSGGGSVTSITAGTNLTGGTITTTGTIALSATPTGLTSVGVGNLSLSANQIISTNSNGNISILPNGTGLVQLGAFPVTVNAAGNVVGNTVDFPIGIIDTLTSQEVDIIAVGGNPGPLRLYDANNSNFVALLAPSIVPTNYGWTWPATDGTSGQVLTTNGSGTLSFTTVPPSNSLATYILQTPFVGLPNAQALSDLGDTGILKINPMGVVQLAIPDVDYATLATLTIYLGFAEAAADEAVAAALEASGSAGAATAAAIAAAASATAAGISAGVLVGATSGTFILKETNALFPNAQALGTLTTGILLNTVSAGVGTLSAATPGVHYYSPGFPTTILDSGSSLFNLFIGTNAGNGSVSGSFNTGFGDKAAFSLTSGASVTALGYQAATAVTTGSRITASGDSAAASIVTANDITAYGYHALTLATVGPNSAFGSGALSSLSTATNCSAFGMNSLAAMTTGGPCAAFGHSVLSLNTANNNAGFGAFTLASNINGTRNSAFGINAASSIVSVNDVTAFGYNSLTLATVGAVTAFGSNSLSSLTTGTHAAAFGSGALSSLVSANDCSGFGYNALTLNTAANNSSFGSNSGASNTSGSGNSSFGAFSLGTNITGSDNTVHGHNAGNAQNTYNQCTFIGKGADASANNLTNASAFGYNASVSTSNSLILGNSANVGIGTSSPTRSLTVIGGQIVNIVEVATSYTVLDTDYIVGVTDTTAARTITLPTAASANKGQPYVVKDESGAASGNNITVNVTGGGNIDGSTTAIINTNYGSLNFYSNGTQWYIW